MFRALYQLQFVKSEVVRRLLCWLFKIFIQARQYVPSDLKLVELFGYLKFPISVLILCSSYTLGGFYLARYSDSPAGVFDEVSPSQIQKITRLVQLVVMSGLVWNAPTSCAWAARVYVNNKFEISAFCVGMPVADRHGITD